MKRRLSLAVLAVALSLGATSMPAAARDDVTISVNPGGIAFGYSDGYWDRAHHWHKWHSHADADWYRRHDREHYYAWRHDRDHDHGWRDADRWWDRH